MQIQKIIFLFILLSPLLDVKAQTYEQQYEACSQPLKNLTTVDSIYFVLASKKDSCLTGAKAPNFEATTMNKEKIESSKLKGRVVVLNFWFTRCEPCIAEMPGFNKLVSLYKGKKVEFISFTYEDSDKVKEFLQKHSFKFKIVANNDTVRWDIFRLFSTWPYNVVIDQKGNIAEMRFGSRNEETYAYYKKLIDTLLVKGENSP